MNSLDINISKIIEDESKVLRKKDIFLGNLIFQKK